MPRLLLALSLLLLPATASAQVDRPCHTPALFRAMQAPPGLAEYPVSSRDKDARNPYGVPNEDLTENFAIRWGDAWTPNISGLSVLAEALEDAWQTEIETMAHPAPWSTSTTLLNVYIGDTGGGTPSSFGAGGYFNPDEEGYPVLVINPASLDEPSWTRVVAIHEFYHSVQWGLDTYTYVEGEPGAWYWEATASWIPGIVDPQSPTNANFIWGFALAAHLPLDAFDYPDSGQLQEYHQYGAMIFPTFLSEQVTDWQPVRNSWVDPFGGTGDPIEALRAELSDLGHDFDDVFVDFVAHNVFWDYTHGATYELYVDGGAQSFPGEDDVTSWVTSEDTGTIPASEQPRRYGSNTLRFDLDDGPWELELSFDDSGSAGSVARWGATLVRRQGASITYEPIEIADGEATVALDIDGSELALSVAAWAGPRVNGERFEWSYSVIDMFAGDDDDTGDDDDMGDDDDAADDDDSFGDDDDRSGFTGTGCRCDATGGPGAGAWLLLPLVLSRGRRRRR